MDEVFLVTLLPGTYWLARPRGLAARDAGTGGHRIFWTGLPVERSLAATPRDLPTVVPTAPPVLSGGVQITGWQPVAPGVAVWSAPAPPGLATRQLYVDGVRAQRASGPVPVGLTSTDT